jgi:hypothetical protein
MDLWDNTSHVVHAVSSTPNPKGGYERVGVAVHQFAHCIDPIMLPDKKTWILFHNGDGSTTGVCPGGHATCGVPGDPGTGNSGGYVADCTALGNGSTPDDSVISGHPAPKVSREQHLYLCDALHCFSQLPPGYEAGNGVHISTEGPNGPWKAGNGTAKSMGYDFGDCPAVTVLTNGSIVSWAQALYADTPHDNPDSTYTRLQLAHSWGKEFKYVQPTIKFPQHIADRAVNASAPIRLDDPTIWVRACRAAVAILLRLVLL